MKAAVISKWFPKFKISPAQIKLAENLISENSEWPLAKCDVCTWDGRDELASCDARQKVIGHLEINECSPFVTTFVDFHEG